MPAAAEGFSALGLDQALVDAVTTLGYEEPTPIQREAIPPLLAGRDVLGQAATGTGKTAAFALPMLQRIGRPRDGARPVRGLVLVPTRELAMQVAEAVHKYGTRARRRACCRSTAGRRWASSCAGSSAASTSSSRRRAARSITSVAGRSSATQ